MAIPLFTVSLYNYTFFLKNLIMGSRLTIVILLYDTSTTFNVAVHYMQCKHLATFTRSRVRIIHENSYFLINSNEKSACVLYMSAYYTRDLTV